MDKRRALLCSLLVSSLSILTSISLTRFKASAQKPATQVNNAASFSPLKEIAGYRLWTRVNEKPRLVVDASLIGG